MSSVPRVPESTGGATARDAWVAVRRRGVRRTARGVLDRFRYGDGFSHARALGFQLALATLPLVIALLGASSLVQAPSLRLVLRQTVLQLTPGASDPLIRRTLPDRSDGSGLETAALAVAVLSAVLALTTAMGQVERGANRVYGIQRDRPTTAKYRRALGMVAVAGLPVMGGSLLLVAGRASASAVETVYGLDDGLVQVVLLPCGVLLVVGGVTAMLRWAPARRQPAWSLLLLGGTLALAAWTALTLLLALFLELSTSVGSVYGPLTGVIALLVWAQLSSTAVFLGLAVSAELELHAGVRSLPATPVRRPGAPST